MFRLFRKIVTTDKDLNSVQDSIGQILNQVTKVPVIDGVLLTGLKITTASQKFNHQLTRIPRGFFVVNKTAAGDIYSPPTSPTVASSNDTTINFQSTADTTADIWVF